jgi:hypothetical protein
MKNRFVLRLFAFVFLGLMGMGLSIAQEGAQEVIWAASTLAEGVPDQLAPGYTTFTLNSDNETGSTLTIFRLKEGTSLEAFQTAMNNIDTAFGTEGGDVATAINEALELGDVLGEATAEAGQSSSVGVVLEEGDYVLDFSPNLEEGMPERTYHTFTVAGEMGATAPEADLTVQLVDFAFALPPDIRAGEQIWEVSNVGQQVHHMVLFKLLEGKTMDDFMAWMETEGEGEPAAEEAGGVGIMSSGQTSYTTLDLSSGDYVAICFLPDHSVGGDGAPHFTKGMMQMFTVTE